MSRVPSGFLSMACGAMAIAPERPQPQAASGCAPLPQEAPLQHRTARAHRRDVQEGQDMSFWCAVHSDHVPLQLWSCQVAVRRAGVVNEAYVSYWASKDLWVAAFSIWKLMHCKEWRQTGAGYFSAAGCPCLSCRQSLVMFSPAGRMAPSRSKHPPRCLLSPR